MLLGLPQLYSTLPETIECPMYVRRPHLSVSLETSVGVTSQFNVSSTHLRPVNIRSVLSVNAQQLTCKAVEKPVVLIPLKHNGGGQAGMRFVLESLFWSGQRLIDCNINGRLIAPLAHSFGCQKGRRPLFGEEGHANVQMQFRIRILPPAGVNEVVRRHGEREQRLLRILGYFARLQGET